MKKRKSYIGWTINKWAMEIDESSIVLGIHQISHDLIYKTRSDCCDMFRLPDKQYKPVKVRITIEEV